MSSVSSGAPAAQGGDEIQRELHSRRVNVEVKDRRTDVNMSPGDDNARPGAGGEIAGDLRRDAELRVRGAGICVVVRARECRD